MEVSLVSFCRERQQGEESKVNRSQRLSLRRTAGEEEEDGREREEDSVIEGERGQEGRSRARGRERQREGERKWSGAHSSHRWLAGWLAHC